MNSFKRWLRFSWRKLIILGVIGGLLIFYIVLPLYRSYVATHPDRNPPTVNPAERGLQYENITFKSSDGVTLWGWYIPSHNNAAIIVTHGFDGSRGNMMPQATLKRCGKFQKRNMAAALRPDHKNIPTGS